MPGDSYSKAGVDLAKVRRLHGSLQEFLGSTFAFREGMSGAPTIPIGHYAGVIDLGRGNALALHTDGVGTKVLVAQEMGKFDTVGIDCVAMTVNDLICVGSEPVALLDYIALESENSVLVEELSRGLVEGAKRASVAIVGGETAIMKDVIKGFDGYGFDLAAMGVGLLRAEEVIDGSKIKKGDSILGVESSGLHSNGYTLARKAVSKHKLSERIQELGTTLGKALLAPTSIYVGPALVTKRAAEVHGFAHITGGSFTKLTRLVRGKKLLFDLTLPEAPPLFGFIMREGRVSKREMVRTFNMGIGFCVVLPEAETARAARAFESHGFQTHSLGKVKEGEGVRVDGLKVA